jgi:putative glutathione S-transferase
MGRLIDGVWSTGDLGADAQGEYVRRAAKFRTQVSAEAEAEFPAEANRYHLYVSHACGWSHRALIFRALKGLEEAISVSFMEDFMGEEGWTFEGGKDPLGDRDRLFQLYAAGQPDYTGRVSVPVLWDKLGCKIVSNESTDIIASFDKAFTKFGNGSPSLYPEGQGEALDAMVAANYDAVNNGVYRCGFAASQEAYNQAVTKLFDRLDLLEELLTRQRYLLGEAPTAADWSLFPTLYRFDAVYYIHFKCSRRQLQAYPKLWAYTRDLYQQEGVASTCKMQRIRNHYYTSHESISPRRIIPIAPDIDFDEPHNRG